MVVGYLIESIVITRVLIRGRQKSQSLREKMERWKQRSEGCRASSQGIQELNRGEWVFPENFERNAAPLPSTRTPGTGRE